MPEGSKSYIVTLVLSYFLGFFGADRFYLGRTRSALFKLLTFGGFGYWWLIDLIITLCGGQRDAWGLRLNGYDRYKKRVWIVIGSIVGASVVISTVAVAVSAAFDSTGPTAFGWVLSAVLAAGAAIGGAIWFLRRRARVKPAKVRGTVDPAPPRIRALVQKITELRPVYIVRAAAGDKAAATVLGHVDSLLLNVTELFRRLSSKADKAERGRAEREYEDKLAKLYSALDRDYLLDVLANPKLWDDPNQRITDVQRAIEAVDTQLLDNIKQVNAHRGLVFQVAIDGLIGPRKAVDDWQRDFDRASGSE